ncbi:MAG: polyprenyl synthetase family protein [Treponemataceae bacterium]|nr:polyprenyl synthetase family protein [Treponemataceae bacterium]
MSGQYTARLQKIEEVLSANLPKPVTAEWTEDSLSLLPEDITLSDVEHLTEPSFSLISLGGKRWRPLLLVLSAELAADPLKAFPGEAHNLIEQAYALTPLVEFVHTASLIHDDIEDKSDMRRGKPAAHCVYGLDFALNAGSWLYFQAAQCVFNSTLEPAMQNTLLKEYLTQVRRLHLGQSLDITWHNTDDFIPGINQYMGMTRLKTGTLAYLAAKIGFLAGGGSMEEADSLAKEAASIGVGFQILDDVINLTTGIKGKAKGDDIVEGKKSLPVILFLEKHPEEKEHLISLFRRAAKEGQESSAVTECVTLLNESGAVEEALLYSRNMINTSCRKIQKTYPDSEAATLLTNLFTAMLLKV